MEWFRSSSTKVVSVIFTKNQDGRKSLIQFNIGPYKIFLSETTRLITTKLRCFGALVVVYHIPTLLINQDGCHYQKQKNGRLYIKNIFLLVTTELIVTKLWWNCPQMVFYQNYFCQSCLPTKDGCPARLNLAQNSMVNLNYIKFQIMFCIPACQLSWLPQTCKV